MFEYIIVESENNPPDFSNRLAGNTFSYKKHTYKYGSVTMECISRLPENDFKYESERRVFFILGSIFKKSNGINSLQYRITPSDLFHNPHLIENPSDLRGLFHIIIIDKLDLSIKLVNDIFGLLPVYYGSFRNCRIISNSLSLIGSCHPELNMTAVLEKLIFDHTLSEITIFKDFFELCQASVLSLNKTFNISIYFDWYEYISHPGDGKFNFRKFEEIFDNIISSRSSRKDANLVILTGGYDGRAVLSSFMKQNIPFETFSFGRPGSENTVVPEMIAKKMHFSHSSVYLLDDFEKNYLENALETIWLSDGELTFPQQSTLYGAKQVSSRFSYAFTGLLAGEILGPVHLIKDNVNPQYYKNIYRAEKFNYTEIESHTQLNSYLNVTPDRHVQTEIEDNLHERKKKLNIVRNSKSDHLFSILDLITYGFRKFYGSQIHLARYHLENIPCFYDFDLINELIQTNYHNIYKSSYNGRWSRRNARSTQTKLIVSNSKELSMFPLDRGFTPYQAGHPLLKYITPFKYIVRKMALKTGKRPPDFLGVEWTSRILKKELFTALPKSSFFNNEAFLSKFIKPEMSDRKLSSEEISLITYYLYISNILKY